MGARDICHVCGNFLLMICHHFFTLVTVEIERFQSVCRRVPVSISGAFEQLDAVNVTRRRGLVPVVVLAVFATFATTHKMLVGVSVEWLTTSYNTTRETLILQLLWDRYP